MTLMTFKHNVVFSAEGKAHISNFDFGPLQDPAGGFDTSLLYNDPCVRTAAPEFVAIHDAMTAWSDVYSFGMFMYEVSTAAFQPSRSRHNGLRCTRGTVPFTIHRITRAFCA